MLFLTYLSTIGLLAILHIQLHMSQLEEIADSGPINKSSLPTLVVMLKVVQNTWYTRVPLHREESSSGTVGGM